MDLFCVFYQLEIHDKLENLINLTIGMYSDGPGSYDPQFYAVMSHIVWNYESVEKYWRALLCGGG